MIRFTVVGVPQPAGSKKIGWAGGKPGVGRPFVVDDNSKSKAWKNTVATTARGAVLTEQRRSGERMTLPLFDVPVEVSMIFRRARPASHLNSKGEPNAEGLRHPFPDAKPDVLKLARAVEDALTGVLYRDDAQIVREFLFKEWGERDEVEIAVSAARPWDSMWMGHAIITAHDARRRFSCA